MILYFSIGAAVVLIILLLSTYTVVKPNQAHVVTRFGRGRKVFSPKLNETGEAAHRTAYFFIPFVMQRQVLDLTNVKLEINDIELHDKEVAPFLCDVVCWFHVVDASLAAERLDLEHERGIFGSVEDSLRNLVPAVAREVAMKQELLDIMRDRQTFGNALESSVEAQIKKWGVDMIDLEINDIRDATESAVIGNYESIRQTQIESTARQQNALRIREAIEAEQENKQKAEIRTAEAEEAYRRRQIEKDKAIGVSEMVKEQEIARQQEMANIQKVEAQRKMDVGVAEIKAQAVVKEATGAADAVKVRGEREAQVIDLTGSAQAVVIEKKGLAEAVAKDKMAEALKKYNEAGITIEQIKAFIAVQAVKWENVGKALSAANLNLVSSDPNKILGFGMDAEGGASLGQFVKALEATTGKGIGEIVKQMKDAATGKAEGKK